MRDIDACVRNQRYELPEEDIEKAIPNPPPPTNLFRQKTGAEPRIFCLFLAIYISLSPSISLPPSLSAPTFLYYRPYLKDGRASCCLEARTCVSQDAHSMYHRYPAACPLLSPTRAYCAMTDQADRAKIVGSVREMVGEEAHLQSGGFSSPYRLSPYGQSSNIRWGISCIGRHIACYRQETFSGRPPV